MMDDDERRALGRQHLRRAAYAFGATGLVVLLAGVVNGEIAQVAVGAAIAILCWALARSVAR